MFSSVLYCLLTCSRFKICESICYIVHNWLLLVSGPLTSHGELHYKTFSVRFEAGRSLTVKSGYYADWVITERSASVAGHCHHCRKYCYHGYEDAAENCASSCRCIAGVDKGTVRVCNCSFLSCIFQIVEITKTSVIVDWTVSATVDRLMTSCVQGRMERGGGQG